MFARVTVIQGPADRADDAIRAVQEQAVPAAKEIPGLVAGYWTLDRSTGKGVVFAVYESEEALQASEERVRQLRESSVGGAGGQIVSVESYEVVGQV